MINHSAMDTFVSHRQATMLAEADRRRIARRSFSARRTARPADARRHGALARSASHTPIEISTTSLPGTGAPISSGGLRSLLRFSRA